jgi:hypothetical protein
MKVVTQFVALGAERTEVRIHQRYVPEAFMEPEAQAGFSTSLDRFAAHLEREVSRIPRTQTDTDTSH